MQKRTFSRNPVKGAFIFWLCIMAVLIFSGMGIVHAASPEEDFAFNAETGCITEYKGSDDNVEVPETIHGETVKGIEWGSFSGKNVKQVVLPDTVETIGAMAFEGCKNLTSIKIPEGVKVIAPYTFYECSSLQSVVLPESAETIMLQAFGRCSSLKEITILKNVKKIEEEAFADCNNDLMIICDKDSYAYEYAQSNGIKFKDANDNNQDNNSGDNSGNNNGNNSEITKYTVTFKDHDGKTLKTETVEKGKAATAPAAPKRSGYTFAGWDKGFEKINSDTTITATYKQILVNKIKITGLSKKIAAGKSVKLTAKVEPANALDSSVSWESSNTKYATVSSSGKVTMKKAGAGKKVTITAVSKDGSNVKATYKIKIMKKAVKKIKLLPKSKSVKAGKKLKITAKVTPSKNVNKTLSWSSNNENYATVNSKGVVTTKKAGKGKSVKITARAMDGSGKKASVKIKIK